MRFLMMVKGPEGQGMPSQAMIDAVEDAAVEATKDGTMIMRGGLYPTAQAALVRVVNGKVTVTDGPFAEAKEVVGGFAIFQFKSLQEAVASAKEFVDLHRRLWPGWVGETEVRQMFDGEPDFEMFKKT
ncbi:MAG TPA: YciI family protein [Thermoanaerobaculia bacterium]|jgi:hypothetical protein